MFTTVQALVIASFCVFVIAVFYLTFFGKKTKSDRERDSFIPQHTPHAGNRAAHKKRYITVSELVMNFFPSFDMEHWAEAKTKETGKTKEDISEEWNVNKERSRQTGIFLRQEIARYFTGAAMKDEFQFYYKCRDREIKESISIKHEEDLFLDFTAKHKLHVYRTNLLISDDTLKVVGRVAYIGKRQDGYELYDWKRNKGITDENGNTIIENAYGQKGINGLETVDDTPFWHYALKLNIYRAILEKNYHLNIVRMTLVDISAKNKSYKKIDIPKMSRETRIVVDFLSKS